MKVTLQSLCFVFTLIRSIYALPEKIKIGGLFEYDDTSQVAFRHTIESVNNNRQRMGNILPRSELVGVIEKLPPDDSFQASRKVCELLRNGVAAIFGPESASTAEHVQSICDSMEIPHIETRWNPNLFEEVDPTDRLSSSINLHPNPKSLGQAYYDIITALQWKSFIILYDHSTSLIRLQSLMKEKQWKVVLYQLDEGNDFRPLLKQIRKNVDRHIVIDVEHKTLYPLLKQAFEMKLMGTYFNYFITSMDMHMIDIKDFRDSNTNITSIRLFDPNKQELLQMIETWKYNEMQRIQRTNSPFTSELNHLSTKDALIHDAVSLFALAMHNLGQSKKVDLLPLYCDAEQTSQHGYSLANYMRWNQATKINAMPGNTQTYPNSQNQHGRTVENQYFDNRKKNYAENRNYIDNINHAENINYEDNMNYVENRDFAYGNNLNQYNRNTYTWGAPGYRPPKKTVEFDGITGKVRFSVDGLRTDFELEITSMDEVEGMKKIGMWSKEKGIILDIYSKSEAENKTEFGSSLKNRHVKVTIAITEPYVMLKPNWRELEGNDRFEGFCVELMDKVAKMVPFTYTFEMIADEKYGSIDDATGEWNGMIRDLIDMKVDLGIVDFTITFKREEVVDFSMPFMNLGIAIIQKKPSKKPRELFSFMKPFSTDVWICMATAYLGVSVLLFFLARMSPREWDNPYPCKQDPDELENCFTLQNSLWFIIATFLCQGADIAPRAVSTRIVAGIWWFFTLIMISSYTANLAAFLTSERMVNPIESAEDLVNQNVVKYGCKEGGSTHEFFKTSTIPTYKRMFQSMTATPTVFTTTNGAGVERVNQSDGLYAFLMESSSIDYEVEKNCKLDKIGDLLDSKSYGIALPQDSPFTDDISKAILKLKETGEIAKLKILWWETKNEHNKKSQNCPVEEVVHAISSAKLGLDNVGGVFVVMVGGGVSACFIVFIEFTWKARKLAAQEGDSFVHELKRELKFLANCGVNEKPIKKPKAPKSDDGNEEGNDDLDSIEMYSSSSHYRE